MFEYFPDNYSWSAAVNLALAAGGSLGEFDRYLSPLRSRMQETSAWQAAWVEAALHQEHLAELDEANGFARAASRRALRAAVYHAISEASTPPGPLKAERYSASLHAFANANEYAHFPLERVEIPVNGGTVPAILRRSMGPRTTPRPVVIAVGGPDLTKELVYCLLGDVFAFAGVDLFAVDVPGCGEALRLGALPAHANAGGCIGGTIDHLTNRTDLCVGRIGILGVGFGGYHALRAAALDPRIEALALWSGISDVRSAWIRRLQEPDGLEIPAELQLPWTMGTADVASALDRCVEFSVPDLTPSVHQPMIAVHGRADPLTDADDMCAIVDSCPSRDKTTWLFEPEDGGLTRFQVDQPAAAADILSGWFADRLQNPVG